MSFEFSKTTRQAMVTALASGVIGCTSVDCCITATYERPDAVHYVVVGFGIISVPKPQGQIGVLATNLMAVGLVASDQPGLRMGLGYSGSSVVAIPSDTKNALVEVSTCGTSGLLITAKTDEDR